MQMRLSEVFAGDHLKSEDLAEGDLPLTIKKVETKEFEKDGGGKEMKLIIHFRETEKTLVSNKTNANTIANLYTDETDNWVGKRITLYATEVEFQGKTMLGIRVRLRPPTNGTAPKADAHAERAKGAAWLKFKESNPGESPAALGAKFTAAVKAYFGTTTGITGPQWDSFAAADFQKPLEEAAQEIFAGSEVVPPDDIPF
jgi:hypothetical protein